MLKLKLQYFGRLIRRADSLENILMTGKKGVTEAEKVGWHHQLSGRESEQTPGDSEGREAWFAAVHRVEKSQTRLSEQQLLGLSSQLFPCKFQTETQADSTVRAQGVVSLCSLMSAAAGVCANTAHQPLPRAECEQSHTMSPGYLHPSCRLPDGDSRKGGKRKVSGWVSCHGWERKLVQDLPPQPLLTAPPGVLEDLAALWPRAPQRQQWQGPGSQPGPWRSLWLGLPLPWPSTSSSPAW